jgi:FkbM family methyltransferase
MNLPADQRNPFLSAYSLVRRSGLLRTTLGRYFFKSAYFLYKRYIEDELLGLVHALPFLAHGGDVLDIGANIGYTAAVLARVVDPGRRVYAFEPEEFNFRILEQMANQVEFEGKITPLRLAVGAQEGTVKLWINDRHHADHRVITQVFRSVHPESREITVPMISVDSLLEKEGNEICFVKIDVQGYEFAVCQGMQNTLERNPEISVLLEFTPSAMREMGFEPSDLIRFFEEKDFKAYQIHPRGKLTSGVPAIADTGYCNLLFSRRKLTGIRQA